MSVLSVAITVDTDHPILAPAGTLTPYHAVSGLTVDGGRICSVLSETELGLSASLIAPEAETVTLHYALEDNPIAGTYPDAAMAGGGRAGIEALVAEAEARFDYAHPEACFTDGQDSVPYLSCGLTPGSCVDINTYLVASLRAAGYEAGYFYGYFFPQERGGITDDGHCWVATRHAGEVLEWDIAHHIKAGLGPTRPGLNPRPGARVALTHSMGHRYAAPGGVTELKILGEPMYLPADRPPTYTTLEARLRVAESLT